MTEIIGFQDGITAWADWFRAMGTWQTAFAKWTALPNELRAITIPPVPPKIAARGPNYNPNDMSTWPWPDKLERTLRILKDANDAEVPPDPPDPPDPPTYVKVAPITVREEGGSDQRVCLFTGEVEGGPLRPGVVKIETGPYAGQYTDESRARYESSGLENTSIRTKATDPRLVLARQMDGRNACQCPPVGDPTLNTGSWEV